MKILVFLASTVALARAASTGDIQNVYQFGKMIMCLGDLGYFEGLEYNGYGCYCGYGGEGTPLDETDTCCKLHDECYGRAKTDEIGCWAIETYGTIYDYEKYTDESGNCAIKCTKEEDYPWYVIRTKCKAFMCECDRIGAQCFADKRSTFNPKLIDYDNDNC
ncbi:phospholipase A2 AP-PLA2-I-like [Acanthaster planci]|uniref:Phospholipase A2 n=1 Tax=Acanthaster planci TaxID=133434 RepID=A0A8B8A4E3_ACAPL|nr:phospholipase A2 AP-PLA2-I-like [Acanthaster planci]